jgi:hypothetical protein
MTAKTELQELPTEVAVAVAVAVMAGAGANGGSGVVTISYPNTFSPAASTTGSPTFADVGGNLVYTFTGSGSITF